MGTHFEQEPLYIPFESLNSTEAKTYFEWFMSVKDARTENFMKFFQLTYSISPTTLFPAAFDNWIFQLFDNNPQLVTVKKIPPPSDARPDIKHIIEQDPPRQVLTSLGYAIAADCGLLCAKIIMDNRPDLVWDIVLSGGKRYVHHHKAVIKLPGDKFGSSEWDPILIGIQSIGYPLNISRIPYDYAAKVEGIINKKA